MPTDRNGRSGSRSGQGGGRRPVILDIPAEEVGRGPSDPTGAVPGAFGRVEPTAENNAGPQTAEASSTSSRTEEMSVDPRDTAGPDAASTNAAEAQDSGGDTILGGSTAARSEPSGKTRRGTSFPALLTAAILGGAIGAGGVAALQRTGYIDPIVSAEQPAETDGAGAPELRADLEALRGEIAALQQVGAAASPAVDLAPVQAQIAGLETALAEIRDRRSAPGNADPAALEGLQTRLAEVEATAGAAADPAALQALEGRVGELAGQVEQLQSARGGELNELQTSLTETQTRLGELTQRVEAAPREERVATLETGLEEARAQAAQAQSLIPAVAAGSLAEALRSGAPFAGELGALRTLRLDAAALAQLEPLAQSGLPTLPALRAQFEAAAAEVDVTPAPAAEVGTLDRLVQSARGLVEVRPAGPVSGAGPGAILARVRAALDAGDLRTALAERETLPEDAKARTADWARAAAARLAAEDLVARLRSDALARLGTAG